MSKTSLICDWREYRLVCKQVFHPKSMSFITSASYLMLTPSLHDHQRFWLTVSCFLLLHSLTAISVCQTNTFVLMMYSWTYALTPCQIMAYSAKLYWQSVDVWVLWHSGYLWYILMMWFSCARRCGFPSNLIDLYVLKLPPPLILGY